ncbi:MAG: host attachment protein [Parachlamydiales bacterium]|nr:host attachment protein [Parachlamydiales bacterium]
MSTLLVLLANSSFAQFFNVKNKGKEIAEVQSIAHPEGREKPHEIVSDSPGTRMGGPAQQHSLAEGQDIHRKEQHIFAHQLVDFVKKAKNNNQFDELAVVAPAQFLGELRKVMTSQFGDNYKFVAVAKDLPPALGHEKRLDKMCEYLDLWNR